MGAGETSITIVAAAVANAIFDATGARVREVPFTPAREGRARCAAARSLNESMTAAPSLTPKITIPPSFLARRPHFLRG
jgi:hypothetical protein